MSTETTEALIERVLAEHEWDYPDSFCKCDAWVSLDTPWRAHVAAAITQALAEQGEVEQPRRLCEPTGWAAGGVTESRDLRDTESGRRSNWDRMTAEACPLCGPTGTEQHPRRANVTRCANCKEWLTWAEDAAASQRALYDTDSGRRDNWSER